jgi:hypothetical protein
LTKPQFATTATKVNHRTWHLGITVLVGTDAVGVREAEELGHPTGVDQIAGIDSRHRRGVYNP